MTPIPLRTAPRRRAPARRADAELAVLARALSHPARVAIVRLLAQRGDCLCGEIVSELPLAQATVSQHLKVLREAGILVTQEDGPRVCYCLQREPLERLVRLLGEL